MILCHLRWKTFFFQADCNSRLMLVIFQEAIYITSCVMTKIITCKSSNAIWLIEFQATENNTSLLCKTHLGIAFLIIRLIRIAAIMGPNDPADLSLLQSTLFQVSLCKVFFGDCHHQLYHILFLIFSSWKDNKFICCLFISLHTYRVKVYVRYFPLLDSFSDISVTSCKALSLHSQSHPSLFSSSQILFSHHCRSLPNSCFWSFRYH